MMMIKVVVVAVLVMAMMTMMIMMITLLVRRTVRTGFITTRLFRAAFPVDSHLFSSSF